MNTNTSKRYGAMYGQAIGDALGVPIEFKKRREIEDLFPQGGPFDYAKDIRTHDNFEPGEWSDDTEQALCILYAYLEGDPNTPIEQQIAKQIHRWFTEDGKGCGGHTREVVTHKLFLETPLQASQEVWEGRDRGSAPNGGVMRTAAVGIINPWDLNWTENAAVSCCAVTHFDPRCVASAVAVSIAIAGLIQGWAIKDVTNEAMERAFKYNAEVIPFIRTKDLGALDLDREGIGYTYKCMGAGFWALRKFEEQGDFLTCLVDILREGGDTDTNGAVAGALLGAACGVDHIPQGLVDGLQKRAELHEMISRVCLRRPKP